MKNEMDLKTKSKSKMKWEDAEPVFVVVPQCPACRSLEYKLVRVMPRESDGSWTHRRICSTCGHAYKVVHEIELP